MTIESTKVIVNSSPATVMAFLADAQNLIHLLPEGKISDFKATVEQCSFKVQGGFTISLIENGSKENSELYLKSGEGSPFPFKLTIHLKEVGTQTEGYIFFDGEVNMFLKMMVEKPLTSLFNYMSEQLKKYYEKGI